MPTIYLDAAFSDEERRHRLYAGDLFAFSPGNSATKLAELAQELSEAAFAPHDPEVAQDNMPPEQLRGDPRRAQAQVHPPPAREGADRGDAHGGRRRHRAHVLRRPPPSHDGAQPVHERRPRTPVPLASRHVVLGAAAAAQLVAAGVRDRVRELDGVPSAVLRPRDQEHIVRLRLRRVEPHRAPAGGQAGQEGHPRPAAGRRGTRALARRPHRLPARRPDRLLRRAAAHDGAEHHPRARASASTSARSTSTT